MSEWKPIDENTPRDGTYVDVWTPSGRRADVYWGRPNHSCGEAGRYCDDHPNHDGWCDEYGYLVDDEEDESTAPTHWRPLPAPPDLS